MIAIIPARGGSTRIPRKNIRAFHGKPMLAHAIKVAQDAGLAVHVSTEDVEVARVAAIYGASIVQRPIALAENDIGTQAVMRHAVKTLGLSANTEVCCIYPCTPLLTAVELRKARILLESEWTQYVVAVNEANGGDTGWFYYGKAQAFANCVPLWGVNTRVFPIATERAVDVNTPEDWARVEALYQGTRRAA